jgi:hypothetical protein
MSAMTKVRRPDEELVAACETQLHFLLGAFVLYPEDPERFKQIAGPLRILVCRTRSYAARPSTTKVAPRDQPPQTQYVPAELQTG